MNQHTAPLPAPWQPLDWSDRLAPTYARALRVAPGVPSVVAEATLRYTGRYRPRTQTHDRRLRRWELRLVQGSRSLLVDQGSCNTTKIASEAVNRAYDHAWRHGALEGFLLAPYRRTLAYGSALRGVTRVWRRARPPGGRLDLITPEDRWVAVACLYPLGDFVEGDVDALRAGDGVHLTLRLDPTPVALLHDRLGSVRTTAASPEALALALRLLAAELDPKPPPPQVAPISTLPDPLDELHVTRARVLYGSDEDGDLYVRGTHKGRPPSTPGVTWYGWHPVPPHALDPEP